MSGTNYDNDGKMPRLNLDASIDLSRPVYFMGKIKCPLHVHMQVNGSSATVKKDYSMLKKKYEELRERYGDNQRISAKGIIDFESRLEMKSKD